MSWRDHSYNRGADAAHNFFSNPATILSYALPIGRWFGSRVVLHFWFLLGAAFILINASQMGRTLLEGTLAIVVLFVMLLAHEFTHRFAARRVGGQHEEFVLWPLGGMNPVVTPPAPKALFIGNVAGIAVNGLIGAAAAAVLITLHKSPLSMVASTNPFFWINFAFSWPDLVLIQMNGPVADVAISFVHQVFFCSLGLVVVNLLPYAWFDGANIWQAILWPLTGLYRAVYIVCMAGMVIAVPMFVFALLGTSLLGMILWVLLFSSSYMRFTQLRTMGAEGLDEAIGYATTYEDTPRRRKRRAGWFKSAARKVRRDQKEQARIDAILAKVHERGLHSLTWWEKRALKKATERQRQQDLAEKW